ncbi:MAG: chorismate mutase [Rhodospirillales bacterium]|nr:chorismate mutase [Rhodospirillales bacterium]MDP6804154.1 chorismate mutase [Rhodospirillales bacterium]
MLRREIDAIDRAIHELLMDRADVATRIRRLKSETGAALRPGREAEIIRGLLDDHRGPLSKQHLVRIWREILAGSIGLQGPFSIAVYELDDQCGFGDVGRDHFGLVTPMTVYRSPGQVIDAVVRGSAAVGILPLPSRDEKAPWWPHLVSEEPGAPQIVARLPFAGHGNGRGGALEALVIGRLAFEPTGHDRTYLAIEVEGEISLSSLGPVLAGEDLAPAFTALWSPEHTPGASLFLAEVDDFVAAKDRRIPRLVQTLDAPVRRVLILGGYAVPLGADELAAAPTGAATKVRRPRARSRGTRRTSKASGTGPRAA